MAKNTSSSSKTIKEKLFISWAGERSHECAKFFIRMLKERYDILTNSIFISSELETGKRPMNFIVSALNQCKIGLFFITYENRYRPWIYFEAGAIYKADDDNSIIPIYIDIKREEIYNSPLFAFQDSNEVFSFDLLVRMCDRMRDIFGWKNNSSWGDSYKEESQKSNFDELLQRLNLYNENDENKKLLNRLSYSNEIVKIGNNCNDSISCMAHLGEDEFFKIRKTVISLAEGSIILAGHSLYEGMSSSNNRSILNDLVNRIADRRIKNIKIFLMDIMIFENELKMSCQAVHKVMSTQDALLRDLFPICESSECRVDVYFLPLLDIDHVVMTDDYMLYRNTKQWTPHGDLKGEFCLYSSKAEKGEYSVQKKYYERLAMCCTDINLDIDSNRMSKDTEIARSVKVWRKRFQNAKFNYIHLHKLYMSQLLHYVACDWLGNDTQSIAFCKNNIIESREQLFDVSNLLDDNTQRVLLGFIKETEEQLTDVVKKYDRIIINSSQEELSGAWIYPSLDLGFPNNVTRLAGGFATGMLVTWRCGTPIVPIDATVNVCSSSVFCLPDSYDISKSSEEFVTEIEQIVNKAAKTGNHFSFDTGNHFLMIAQSKNNNKKYLVLHSSAKEFKDSYVGLYPSLEGQYNWYSGKYRISPSPKTPERYLRYLRGEDAKHFVWLAHQLETVNEQIHAWFASEIGNGAICKHSKMEKTTYHHYYMPTDTSIAIGTYVESPGTTVPIFSYPGKPICIFKIAEYDNWTIELNGIQKCVVPHGWGQEINDLLDVVVSKGKLKIVMKNDSNKEDTISYDITKEKYIQTEKKHLREFNSCQDFLNKGSKFLKGNIVDELLPIFLYCSSKKGKIE